MKKNKDKEKGLERKNKTGNHKKEKRLMKENFVIEYFDVVLFMKQKQRRKKRKERDKTRKQKKAKKRNRKERKKGQEEERDRERKIQKGGCPKKLRRNKGRHSKINKKCPFLGENKVFCIKKQRKETTKKQIRRV